MGHIAKQQKELDRWDKLNYLIGSADGKKFRRYAQGLTLDYLIQLANRRIEIAGITPGPNERMIQIGRNLSDPVVYQYSPSAA